MQKCLFFYKITSVPPKWILSEYAAATRRHVYIFLRVGSRLTQCIVCVVIMCQPRDELVIVGVLKETFLVLIRLTHCVSARSMDNNACTVGNENKRFWKHQIKVFTMSVCIQWKSRPRTTMVINLIPYFLSQNGQLSFIFCARIFCLH